MSITRRDFLHAGNAFGTLWLTGTLAPRGTGYEFTPLGL